MTHQMEHEMRPLKKNKSAIPETIFIVLIACVMILLLALLLFKIILGMILILILSLFMKQTDEPPNHEEK